MTIDVQFSLECEPEEMAIRGNFASGDDEQDEEHAREIKRQLDRGNVWAWCCVKVTASIEFEGTTFFGVDYLGGCSYRNEKDFKEPGGYYDDMKTQALDDLRKSIVAAVKRGEIAARALKALEGVES